MSSIFRKKRTYDIKSELDQNLNSDKLNFRIITHVLGMPRARVYSLTCKLYFTEYSGFTIEKLIETNFNYFTWLPKNIPNFTYDDNILKYAKVCLEFLEKIDNQPIENGTKLGKEISQIDAMIKYEHHLDFDSNKGMVQYYKMMVNAKYYKSIFNTRTERLIRQAREIDQKSSE